MAVHGLTAALREPEQGDTMQTRSHLSRRALLSGSAASLALPLLPRSSRAQSPAVSEAAWRELGRNITGGVLRPNDPRFVRLTQPENLRYYNPPAQPGTGGPTPTRRSAWCDRITPQEVAYAIKWARDNNLPMVPRSGGHSYAGCSTVPGLVISSSAMQSVKVEDGLIEAGGGALFGHLLAACATSRPAARPDVTRSPMAAAAASGSAPI